MSLYLDYNASAPIDSRVLDKMIYVYKNYIGNADSRTHDHGDRARNVVEDARKKVASLLGITSSEVFFTSGATESNNIAIQGLVDYADETGKKHIITTTIEHKAVLETVKQMEKRGFKVDIVSPKSDGRIDHEEILNKLCEDTLLVSVMHVNNETGIIQPVLKLGNELTKRDVLFHVDAAQSCGKLVDEIKSLQYSTLSFSAHKLRGPQGVGVLVMRKQRYKRPPVKSIMYGGHQENGIRPGTIPVALVAGCGEACMIAQNEYIQNDRKQKKIKSTFIKLLNESGIKYHINGDQAHCVSNTINIYLVGVSSEALMISTKQFCSISNGSACTSRNYSPSYVLTAMGLSTAEAECSLRISWGPEIDLDAFVEQVTNLINVARSLA